MADTAGRPRRLVNTGSLAMAAAVERRLPWWPRERIERLQRRRLRSIVRHAYETVPFYREAMHERGRSPGDFRTVADLAMLPPIDGDMVRRDPERFVSSRYDDRSRHVWYTTGSPTHGSKLIYWDLASIRHKLALAERDRAVLAGLVGQGFGQRQLFILPPSALPFEIRDRWHEQLILPRSLADRHRLPPDLPFAEIARAIGEIRPHVVFSFGSFADHFFRESADRGRSIAVPKVWVYGGDMLSVGGRELIEARFGCPVYSTYQAVETGRLGFQCERRGGFHLNIDLCAVHIVDGAGREVGPDVVGDLIVSNLHNRAMVLLNYRIGDRGALSGSACACGRSLPILERLEGRRSETIVLADGRTLSSLGVEVIFRHELQHTIKVQIAHPAPGRIRWRIVPCTDVDREWLRVALIDGGRKLLGEGTEIEVEFVDEIPSSPQGKFQRVVVPVDPEPGGGERPWT